MEHGQISQKNIKDNRLLGEFPDNFIWGCATSPTQVEGNICNEWKDFTAQDGSRPDEGGDHWNNFSDDIKNLKELCVNSYRMGIDWARLQHAPYADLNKNSLQKYQHMLDSLHNANITPMVTLFHFACPEWFAKLGGWTNNNAPEIFADFVEKLLTAGLHPDYWVTVNEPGVYITMGYLIGMFPPFKRMKFQQCRLVLNNLSKAHRLAFDLIKKHQPSAKIGICKHLKKAIPHRRWHPLDHINAWIVRHFFCRKIHEKFIFHKGESKADFIGVNYYGRLRLKGFRDISPVSCNFDEITVTDGTLYDDMWEQDAGWVPSCLSEVSQRFNLPIIITECGFATNDENLRSRLLQEHLHAVLVATVNGIDVRGFYYWSFIDNFEWAEGLTKKFGLYEVDFDNNQKRSMRPAGRLFANIARNNSIHLNT